MTSVTSRPIRWGPAEAASKVSAALVAGSPAKRYCPVGPTVEGSFPLRREESQLTGARPWRYPQIPELTYHGVRGVTTDGYVHLPALRKDGPP